LTDDAGSLPSAASWFKLKEASSGLPLPFELRRRADFRADLAVNDMVQYTSTTVTRNEGKPVAAGKKNSPKRVL
jgi:hypothetical protein